MNPSLAQPRPQQRLSGGPGSFPRPVQQQQPQGGDNVTPASAAPSSSSSVNLGVAMPPSPSPDDGAASSSEAELRATLDRVSSEYRAYKRAVQEELADAKRARISLQNQLSEAQAAATESSRALSESAARVAELQASLLKSRAAAESELNFFNLEVEKEIARSKQDKEKQRLQATLASYEDAHKKVRFITPLSHCGCICFVYASFGSCRIFREEHIVVGS
jgi:hypothetical protein